jgi:hypothetical protein
MRGTVYLSLGGFTSYDLESGKGLSTGWRSLDEVEEEEPHFENWCYSLLCLKSDLAPVM